MATVAPAATVDRPFVGVVLIIIFCVLAPLGDAIGKLLGAMPLGQPLLARYAIQAALLLPFRNPPSRRQPTVSTTSPSATGARTNTE